MKRELRRGALLPGPFDRFVGVGLGIDVHNEQPDWRRIVAQTHSGELAVDFLEVYTRGDVEGAKAVKAAAGDIPLLYHDDAMDPILPGGVEQSYLDLAVANLTEVGAPWCVSELATRRIGERYLDFFMPILLTKEAADVAAANLRELDAHLGARQAGRIVAENPPYQLPVGPLHVLELLSRVVESADISCVLDLGHLYSFQICRGLEPLAGFDDFPHERIVELHVAGAIVEDTHGAAVYQDSHGAAEILPVLLEMLAEVAPRCPSLKAITIEVEDGDHERVTRQLAQTRAAVRELLEAR